MAADGSGDCRSVDGAMLRARPGDTILVGGGQCAAASICRERLTIASREAKNPAALAGVWINGVNGIQLKDSAVISAEAGGGIGAAGMGNQTTVSGCQIRGFASGFSLDGQDLTVEGSTFSGNGARAVHGESPSSSWKIKNKLIAKNGGGLFLGGQAEISGNTIIENLVTSYEFLRKLYKSQAFSGVGILVTLQGSRVVVFNNILASNTIGCLIDPGVQATIEYNDFFMQAIEQTVMKTGWALNGNNATLLACTSNLLSQINHTARSGGGNLFDTYAPQLLFTPSPTNMSADPLFVDPMKGDYRLSADSPLVGHGRGKADIGASPSAAAADEEAARDRHPSFGISVRPLTDADRQTPGWPSLQGLRVTDIKKGSPAESLQIKPDDVILEINGAAFKDVEEFKNLIAADKVASVKVLRAGKELALVPPIEF